MNLDPHISLVLIRLGHSRRITTNQPSSSISLIRASTKEDITMHYTSEYGYNYGGDVHHEEDTKEGEQANHATPWHLPRTLLKEPTISISSTHERDQYPRLPYVQGHLLI